jgi:hypothetical protein
MSDEPRMTDGPTDEADQAWADILQMESGFRAEADLAPALASHWESTEAMLAELGKIGLDASKLKLPSQSWSPDQAYEALAAAGITRGHFSLPEDPPKTREQKLYSGLGRK